MTTKKELEHITNLALLESDDAQSECDALRQRLTRNYAARLRLIRERNEERRKRRALEAMLREINDWIGTEAGSRNIPYEPPWYARMHKMLEDGND